jgi:DNA-binding transcriptional LysR family regulator
MSFTRFTLRQIEAFLAVAEMHSFSAASARLGLTAQAVSQLVAELESHLDFRLFDRTTRRVELSSAGRDFLPSAQTLMRHVQGAESVADDVRHRAAGVLRIGAPLVLACTALPEAIKEFQKERPRVVVRVRDLAVDQLVDSVAAGDVDLAVGPDRATGDGVLSEPLFDSAWVMWCSPKHPLAKQRSVRWSDLRSQPLVAAGHDHERSVAQMRLNVPEESRIVPLDVVDNISTAMGVAAQGKVATLAPAYIGVLAYKFGLVMRRVLEPETVRKVCLYKNRSRKLSPAAESFADHLSEWLPAWAQGQALKTGNALRPNGK